MLGLAGEDLHPQGARPRGRLRPGDRGPAGRRSPTTPGSRASPPSIASSGSCSRARASRRSTRRPGTPFDPREHEAIAPCPGTGRPDGEIVEELRRGYRLRDRVIRPALVAVADGADDDDAGDGSG